MQKINDLLNKYKDNFSMIRKVITEEVVDLAAAGNEMGCLPLCVHVKWLNKVIASVRIFLGGSPISSSAWARV